MPSILPCEISKTEQDRFVSKFTVGDNCWEWQDSKCDFGYGFFGIKGKIFRAHRVSFLIFRGEIPNGLCVLHKCDNPKCVRPSHLFLGTRSDNVMDMIKKGRNRAISGKDHPFVKNPGLAPRGLKNGANTHPEKILSGYNHPSRLHPERMATGARHGTKTHPECIVRGEKHTSAKLNSEQVLRIRAHYICGATLTGLSKIFGVTKQSINAVVKRKSWTHI